MPMFLQKRAYKNKFHKHVFYQLFNPFKMKPFGIPGFSAFASGLCPG